ncbi:polysaccharide deacetylase family protein [Deinococcus sonorensis]|uniref:Polysaccharide deacetylase family protein n=2 Tax=Deinococcus sonorensis TaxID=309891 RepID=A0AAU7UC01_9DEIO
MRRRVIRAGLGLLLGALLTDVLGRQLGLGALGGGPAQRPRLALTFDDGPGPQTERLLELLAQHHASATFFLTGERAEAQPELVERLRAAGHQLESHGYTHRHAALLLPWQEWPHLRWHPEPARTARLYRPPWGGHSLLTRWLARRAGVQVALWTAESRDWLDLAPETLLDRLRPQLRPGAVLLLHDGPKRTLALLERLLPELEARGLQAVRLDDLSPQRIGWSDGWRRARQMWRQG